MLLHQGNPVGPAKIIKKYFEASKKFNLKACYIGKSIFTMVQDYRSWQLFPSKEEIIAGILGSLNSPLQELLGL